MQHKIDQTKIDEELMQYALDVVTNNYTCRDVRKWLEGHKHDVKSFLVALTLIKKGNLEDESYQAVGQEFLEKSTTEITNNWSALFQSGTPKQTPLYRALSASLIKKNNLEDESDQAVAQEFLAKFKTEITNSWSPRFQSGTPNEASLASLKTDGPQPSTLSFI